MKGLNDLQAIVWVMFGYESGYILEPNLRGLTNILEISGVSHFHEIDEKFVAKVTEYRNKFVGHKTIFKGKKKPLKGL